MKRLRVGVIGVGSIGYGVHLPGYAKLDNVEIVAVCDIDESKLERAAKTFQVPNTFVDYNEMLQMKDLDAVTIATPNYVHAPATIAALRAGKHVLCEKPLAINAELAEEMAETAEKAGKILMVGVNRRYEDRNQQLKTMIQHGELGEIYAANTGWLRRRGVPMSSAWFMEKAKSGGGPLIDIGVHMLDLAWWLMGTPRPISVSGATYHKIVKGLKDKIYDVEDSAFALIRFEGGITLNLAASWALNIEKETGYLDIYGSEGGAKWEPLTIFTDKNGRRASIQIKTHEIPSHHEEIRHFVECITTGKEPISPGREGVVVMKMLDAIYKSAEIGAEVKL